MKKLILMIGIKKKFSHDIKNIIKMNLDINNIDSLKRNHQHHHKRSQLTNHFYKKIIFIIENFINPKINLLK